MTKCYLQYMNYVTGGLTQNELLVCVCVCEPKGVSTLQTLSRKRGFHLPCLKKCKHT